jgi:hypothetical protein
MSKSKKNTSPPGPNSEKAPSVNQDRGAGQTKSAPITFDPQSDKKARAPDGADYSIFKMSIPPPIG